MREFLSAEGLYRWSCLARESYPHEACVVVDAEGMVHPLDGWSDLESFTPVRGQLISGVVALLHSHPDGPACPSSEDMRSQMMLDIPCGLSTVDRNGKVSEPLFWGDDLDIPLWGRFFRHGPSGTDKGGDCYALIRDLYRQYFGVTLEEVPRDWEWWLNGHDLYNSLFAPLGFFEVPMSSELCYGDLLLCQIPRSPVLNHGAVWLGDGLIGHHLDGRLSAIEPMGRWTPYIRKVIRNGQINNN